MGNLEVRVTNTLDQGAGDESIGIGDFKLVYDYDPAVEEVVWPTESPANYDGGDATPTHNWSNDCGATEKQCQGIHYWGGHNECAKGNSFWRVFDRDQMHPNTNKVRLTGKIFTIDSWDGETFTVDIRNQNGASLTSETFQAWHSQQA